MQVTPRYLTDDNFEFIFPEHGLQVLLDNFYQDRREGLIAEVEFLTDDPLYPGGLYGPSRLNLSSTHAKTALIKALTLCKLAVQPDWPRIVEAICKLSLKRYRQGGDGAVDVGNEAIPLDEPANDYLLEPLVSKVGATLIYGDGESGKSYLAQAVAVSVAMGVPLLELSPRITCNVLYLDWETDKELFLRRVNRICLGAGIDWPGGKLFYRRPKQALIDMEKIIRRDIAMLNIGLTIVDSLGFSLGDEPESAAAVIKAFNSINAFGVPTFCTHHLNREKKFFGSIYFRNSARSMWEMKNTKSEGGIRVSLLNDKLNEGVTGTKLGFRYEFENDPRTVSFHKTTFEKSAFVERLSKQSQYFEFVTGLLQANDGKLTLNEIVYSVKAEWPDLTDGYIRKLLTSGKDAGLFQTLERGTWALIARV